MWQIAQGFAFYCICEDESNVTGLEIMFYHIMQGREGECNCIFIFGFIFHPYGKYELILKFHCPTDFQKEMGFPIFLKIGYLLTAHEPFLYIFFLQHGLRETFHVCTMHEIDGTLHIFYMIGCTHLVSQTWYEVQEPQATRK